MQKLFIILVAISLIFAGLVYYRNNQVKKEMKQEIETEAQNENDTEQLGLMIETIEEGSGQQVVESGDVVEVHYTGRLGNGTIFDSSVEKGTPFEFQVGQGMVIEGWEKGLIGMKVGEKRILTIPPEMAYGQSGIGGVIPPNATLTFEVELLSIK